MKSDWYLPFIGLVLVVLVAPIIPRPVPLAADEPAVITVGVLSPWTGALAPAGATAEERRRVGRIGNQRLVGV